MRSRSLGLVGGELTGAFRNCKSRMLAGKSLKSGICALITNTGIRNFERQRVFDFKANKIIWQSGQIDDRHLAR
ncbi:MAG: hypothetical protein U0670_20240 [Anaerolineae bacterium]